jgi:drug/metabolite transporter (DMT)-like permease
VLGATLAILSAATFALNNAAARRGVVTGTPAQGMVVTVPVGVACFLPLALVTAGVGGLGDFPPRAVAWLAAVGLLHFLLGRYCNYRANQAAGVNITAPVIQLQVVVTLVLAVIILREPFTPLQMIGAVLMLAGAFITQRPRRMPGAEDKAQTGAGRAPKFVPRQAVGYLFAAMAALIYGTTPIMVRTALEHASPFSGILGVSIAYGAATLAITLALLSPPLRRNVMSLKRENIRWFVYSGVFVAAAQGLFYSAVAVAPIMVVMPLMQLSLVFRLVFSTWLNRDHEVFGPLVVLGAFVSVVGACTVSMDTDAIVDALALPDALARALRWRV